MTRRAESNQLPNFTVRDPLQRVNETVLQVLHQVTLSQLADEEPVQPVVGLRP